MNVEKIKAVMPLLELAEALGLEQLQDEILKQLGAKAPEGCDAKTYIKQILKRYG